MSDEENHHGNPIRNNPHLTTSNTRAPIGKEKRGQVMFSQICESCVHLCVCVRMFRTSGWGILACLTTVQCFLLALLALSCSCWLTFSLPVKFLSCTLCSRRSQISQPKPAVPCNSLERERLKLILNI